MRYAALILILLSGATNAETFQCQSGTYWSSSGKVVVVATINEDGKTGTIKVAGITHDTVYSVDGFDRTWHFGGSTSAGLFSYSLTLQPDGIAFYYDFKSAERGETVESSQTFFCQ